MAARRERELRSKEMGLQRIRERRALADAGVKAPRRPVPSWMTWHAPEHPFQASLTNPSSCSLCYGQEDSLRHRAVYTDDR